MMDPTPYAAPFAHGIMFHRFHEASAAATGQASLTPEVFEEIIRYVGPSNILSPESWVDRLCAARLKPRDVCITFDDGLRGQFDAALPVLDKYGIKAFWFIHSSVFQGQPDRNEIAQYIAARCFPAFSDYVQDFLARCPPAALRQLGSEKHRRFNAELRTAAPYYSEIDATYRFVRNELLTQENFDLVVDDMLIQKGLSLSALAAELWLEDEHLALLARAGHWIGLHSYDHPFDITRLSEADQRMQYLRNQDHIRSITGKPARSVAHPHNAYDKRTLAVLTDMGIQCGFRADMLQPGPRGRNPNVLELPRQDASIIVALCCATGSPQC